MPGSILQSVNLGNAYNTFWDFMKVYDSSWANSSTGIFTVASHPFTTGDVMYVSLRNSSGQLLTSGKYYAIVISSTELKYASTKENALAEISLNIPGNLWAGAPLANGIGNTPECGYNYFTIPLSYNPTTWISSSRSSDAFDISKNVRIEVTHNLKLRGASYALATPTFNSLFGMTFWREGLISFPAFAGRTSSDLTGTLRFEIINRQISMSAKLTDTTFVTLWTSTQISPSSSPFYFYANFGLNNMSATDCTITY